MPPWITLDLRGDGATRGYALPIADGELWCDEPLAGALPAGRPPSEPTRREAATLVYDGPGLVDGEVQRVRAAVTASGERRVELADGETFWVSRDGDRIDRDASSTGLPASARSVDRAIGPPLALALARRGVFVLHASAVRGADGAAALVAPPGGGKSTLAAAVRRASGSLARIADDQLPVRLVPVPVALPRYPQPKLGLAETYPADAPDRLPLRLLVEIRHDPSEPSVRWEWLGPAEAAIALMRATVAARLFDRDLLRAHLDDSARAAGMLRVARLVYRSGLQHIGAVVAELEAQLSPSEWAGL